MSNYNHQVEVDASLAAGRRVLPLVLSIIRTSITPEPPLRTAIDYGGGTGAWMRSLLELGIENGVVVDTPAAESSLLIPPDKFVGKDLASEIPFLGRFDLALSLEFAEHIPTHKSQELVETLTKTAPIVLFSAAIPGQPGLGHINCQHHQYWHDLFQTQNFQMHDVIRPQILFDDHVPSWYRQNLFLYVEKPYSVDEKLVRIPQDIQIIATSNFKQYTHPSLKTISKRLFPALWTSVRFHLLKK